jgi:apolipoprotein N-acyltransferase
LPALQPGQWGILAALAVGALTSYVRLVRRKKRPVENQVGWIAGAMAAGFAIPWACRGIYVAWGLPPELESLQLFVVVGMCGLVLAAATIVKANT